MGLVIKLNNIISPNAFTVSYKTGPNPYPLDSGFTSYGGTYTAGTTLVVVSGITINFNSSYWFKITDNVTNRYIIENVETNDPIAYSSCCPKPESISAICYHECYPPSNVNGYCSGPTPTPTPTPTIVCDVPTNVSASCNNIEPTVTPTPTPTATPTPTPTPTEIMAQLYWSITSGAGGRLTVYDKDDNELLNENVNLSGIAKSGTLNISQSVLPYKIKGWWQNGSGNLVYFKVCDITNVGELHTSSPLGPSQLTTDEEYVVTPTPLAVSVTMWKDGQPAVMCPE